MPPHSNPPPPERARLPIVWAVVPGLLLGFYAGIELARDGHAPAVRPPAAERSAAAPAAPAPSVTHAPPPGGPTRSSERARIERTDPVGWLARFGEVEAAPLPERR